MTDLLWGKRAKLSYLIIASIVLLFTFLGAREIWTQEHRWADIVAGMFYRHDFLHPYLGEARYYDKPLLSYWLIVLVAKLWGGLSIWTLRIPSALAGLLAVWSIYKIGARLKDTSLGLLSGWMLLTTYYFLFWARTSSADMLNLAGSLFAVAWYFERREKATVFDFGVFFLVLALTSLCKGLGGAIIPVLVVLVDVLLRHTWRQYLRVSIVLSAIPALIIYILPFIASSWIGGESYGENGLYLVYKENVLRYFKPFDHQGPIYTYLIYLPIYLLPWTLFFIPALFSLRSRWKGLSINSKWMVWSLAILFCFFTMSGSRRSYYVLPMVPFAILLTADWILSLQNRHWQKWSLYTTTAAFTILLLAVDILPVWYYSQKGVEKFAVGLQQRASEIKPWQQWKVVMLDSESKLNFYLQLPPDTKQAGIEGQRDKQTETSLLHAWPFIQKKPENTIYITRKRYLPLLAPHFSGYAIFQIVNSKDENSPIAFIPMRSS